MQNDGWVDNRERKLVMQFLDRSDLIGIVQNQTYDRRHRTCNGVKLQLINKYNQYQFRDIREGHRHDEFKSRARKAKDWNKKLKKAYVLA